MAAALILPAAAAPLEFSQVSDLVAAGNRQIAMNALTLAALQSNGTVADAQNNIYQLSGGTVVSCRKSAGFGGRHRRCGRQWPFADGAVHSGPRQNPLIFPRAILKCISCSLQRQIRK